MKFGLCKNIALSSVFLCSSSVIIKSEDKTNFLTTENSRLVNPSQSKVLFFVELTINNKSDRTYEQVGDYHQINDAVIELFGHFCICT